MDDRSKKIVGHKIKTPEELREIIGGPPREKKVIMAHGTFDIVHPGHVRHLLYAKSQADILIASLTADKHIKKANFRPFVPEQLRAINLAALEIVDYVLIDKEETPLANLRYIQPDYFAKGYEYTSSGLPPKTQAEKDVLESYGGEMIFTPGDIVYSSSRLIEATPPNLSVEKLLLELEGEGIDFDALTDAVDKLQGLKVHVVGDTIIDSITDCAMIGGMTKTPTISVRHEKQTDFVGGAGIVAKHLAAAGADVTFTTVLGDDKWRTFTLEDLEGANIKVNAMIDPTRPTTHKNAFVSGGYRLLKVDTLDNRSISEKIRQKIEDHLRSIEADIVVFSDFRHGIFNKETVAFLVAAIPNGVLKIGDSQVASRWGNILDFRDFDLLTPNEREARFALADQDSVIRPLATELKAAANCKTLILKLGARGILLYRTRPEGDPRTVVAIDSFAENIVDPVGAGDALLAYSSLALAATGNDVIAGVLGNMAAGAECEFDGNIPITPDSLRSKIDILRKRAYFQP